MPASVYQFGDFRLDARSFLLLRNGHRLRLEKKPLELLILLVASQSRLVTRAEIAQCLWDEDVFVDTEHGINTAIRKIRAALRDDPETPRFVQTVTGMGYRFIAPTEVVPEDLPAHSAASPPDPLPPNPLPSAAQVDTLPLATPEERRKPARLRWALAALAILFCAAGALALNRRLLASYRAHNRPAQPFHSIAVLPLANYSGDPNQEYFADGMTDELITMLARNSTLRIPSRTSVMHYKTTDRSLQEVARALGVDAILEGSVARSAKGVHLNLQLIQADTDSHLWAESYDRNLTDVAALPEQAARAIATRLNSSSGTPSLARYVSPEAHDAYLQGHYLWSVGRNDEAGKAFQRAVDLQPDYALGWTGVSQYLSAGSKTGQLDPDDVLPRAQAAAEKAVALDPDLPQAHSILAAAIFFRDWDGKRALQEVSRATDLDPRFAEALHLHALILSAMGRYDEALAVQKTSTAADPVTHPGAMAEILMFAREYDRALAEAQLRLRDFPESRDLLEILADLNHLKGQDAQAAEYLARLYAPMGASQPNPHVLDAFHAGGYHAIAQWHLAELKQREQTHYVSPANLAQAYAELGDREATFSLLGQALRKHDPVLLLANVEPAYNQFHTDPRFRSLIQQIGLEQNPQPPSK